MWGAIKWNKLGTTCPPGSNPSITADYLNFCTGVVGMDWLGQVLLIRTMIMALNSMVWI